MHADCILVVENGVVVESGRHGELLRNGGRYASFYRLQLKEQSPGLAEAAANGRSNRVQPSGWPPVAG
jgi:ATP-binding cassette, subfamily B, bacterial MsbA